MAFSAKRKAQLRKFGGLSIARLIRFVARTSTKVTEPPDILDYVHSQGPCIIACWHGQFMMMSSFHSNDYPVSAMVARHGDAALIGHAVEDFGAKLIRGAGAGGRRKDRGGAHALRGACSALEEGRAIVMTADVPPGPARRTGEGIVKLAKLSGCPIVPAAVATTRYHAFKTWSRMTLNLPYSKLAVVAGPHLFIPSDADGAQMEAIRLQVENSLNEVTLRAYDLAGADPARATPPPPQADGSEPFVEPGYRLKTYKAVTRVLEPVAPLILRARARKGKEESLRRNERLGAPQVARPVGPLAWFHAASVGETNAVLPVIEKLGEARPDVNFLLTTGTITSARIAHERLSALKRNVAGERVSGTAIHQYVPLDGPRVVGRFLDHWRPDLAVFTESDIWPNLVLQSSERKIPLALVNARMSNRSFSRWRRNLGMARPLFSRFSVVLAQDDKFARRFEKIGAPAVVSVGNLKIDAPAPRVDQNALNELLSALGGRACFVAASTHEGEDEIIGQAHRILARRIDGFITIIAPRHPERGTGIAEMLKGAGLSVLQRSMGHLPTESCDVYIADTLGELGTLFSSVPAAFIGGSLVEKGGQNPIEAIARGAVVISGQHRHNFRAIYATLARHDAVKSVWDANSLADAVYDILDDRAMADTMRAHATSAVATMAGALERTVAALLVFLPESQSEKTEELEEQQEGRSRASF